MYPHNSPGGHRRVTYNCVQNHRILPKTTQNCWSFDKEFLTPRYRISEGATEKAF
jgi:hypothetical protein